MAIMLAVPDGSKGLATRIAAQDRVLITRCPRWLCKAVPPGRIGHRATGPMGAGRRRRPDELCLPGQRQAIHRGACRRRTIGRYGRPCNGLRPARRQLRRRRGGVGGDPFTPRGCDSPSITCAAGGKQRPASAPSIITHARGSARPAPARHVPARNRLPDGGRWRSLTQGMPQSARYFATVRRAMEKPRSLRICVIRESVSGSAGAAGPSSA